MSLRATAVTFALSLALLAPTASATLLVPTDSPQALDAWGLTPRQIADLPPSASTDLALGIARDALTLSAAGDVDADGVPDLILQSVDLNGGFTQVQALSGQALGGLNGAQDVLWSYAPNLGSVFQVVGDIDGDGVTDFLVAQTIGQATAQGQAVGEAAVGTVDAQGTALFQVIDGASASGRFGVQLASSAGSQAVGAADAGVQQATQTIGQVQATGQGALHQIEQQIETTQATLLSQLPLDVLSSVEVDAVITILDATGAVRGTINLEQPDINPVLLAAPDLDLDGLPDTVIMQVQKISPAQEASAVIPTVTSYVGASVSQAWSVDMDPLAGIPLLIPDVGDLNGDGTLELAYHAIDAVPGSDPSGTALTILNGANGQVLGQLEAAEGLLVAAPLGGSIDGDASAELLLLEGTADAITKVSVADASLETIWSLDIPTDAAPINIVSDPFTGATEGLSDLTGDGVPDLALMSGFTADALGGSGSLDAAVSDGVLEVYSGVDGSLAWSKDLGSVLAVAPIEGLVSGGVPGIAVVQGAVSESFGNGLQAIDDLSLLLLRATDGAGILRLPLLETDVVADLAADLAVAVSIDAGGDLDADGVEDVLVRVEAVLEDASDVAVSEIQGQAVAATSMAFDQVYAVSGKTGELLESQLATSGEAQASVSGNAAASVSLDAPIPPGAVEELEAFGVDSANDPVEASAPGFIALIGALAAVALARRRH